MLACLESTFTPMDARQWPADVPVTPALTPSHPPTSLIYMYPPAPLPPLFLTQEIGKKGVEID
jgi:hypothetical protein